MTPELTIQEDASVDYSHLQKLYSAAFPDEELFPLVEALLKEEAETLSLIGLVANVVASHVLFTTGSVANSTAKVALLGPLAVSPDYQQKGMGTALIKNGLSRLKNSDVARVYVLGAPAYYSRIGFDTERNTIAPFPLPSKWKAAWQSIALDNDEKAIRGKLILPKPWMQPGLWQ